MSIVRIKSETAIYDGEYIYGKAVAVDNDEGVVVEIVEGTSRHIPHYDLDKFYYIIESPELLQLENVRLTRIEGEE